MHVISRRSIESTEQSTMSITSDYSHSSGMTTMTQSGDYYLKRGRYQYFYELLMCQTLSDQQYALPRRHRHLRYLDDIYRDGFKNGFQNMHTKSRKIMILLSWMEAHEDSLVADCFTFVGWLDDVYNDIGTEREAETLRKGYETFCRHGRDNGMDATIDCLVIETMK